MPRPNDPYAAPGTQDMTADVNFTDLARAGQAAGLQVVHFGPERDLTGDDLPALLRPPPTESHVAKFLGNPVFKVLVLGTRRPPMRSTRPAAVAPPRLPEAIPAAVAQSIRR